MSEPIKLILVNPPAGYKKEAEYRPIKRGEAYLSVIGSVHDCAVPIDFGVAVTKEDEPPKPIQPEVIKLTLHNPPEGYEAEAEYRHIKAGEVGWSPGEPWVAQVSSGGLAIVLTPAWKWPEWLKGEWIAMDKNGLWCAYSVEPTCENSATSWGYNPSEVQILNKDFINYSLLPPCTDWTKSLRRNPNAG